MEIQGCGEFRSRKKMSRQNFAMSRKCLDKNYDTGMMRQTIMVGRIGVFHFLFQFVFIKG